jgi:5'-nucleotidase/UDP-sugar diphosphatase
VGLIGLLACTSGASGELTLLHINDLHGRVQPERASWLDGDPAIGGLATVDARVRWHRERGPALFLDGGDQLSGTPEAELEPQTIGRLLGLMELDAWSVGNHELDRGWEAAAEYVRDHPVPAVSANLEGDWPGLQPSVVIERAGLRVGVIGGMTQALERVVSRQMLGPVTASDLVRAVAAEVARLDPQTDLLVALTHNGVEDDKLLAEAVPELDVIVGGHSHTPLKEPIRVGQVLIVQAGSFGRSLGELRVTVEEDRVTAYEGRLVDLVEPIGEPSPRLLEEISALSERVGRAWDAPIGRSTQRIGRSWSTPSDLGTWITHQMQRSTGADVALYNSGGLRADIPSGEVSRRDLFQVFPFGNTLTSFTISGIELERLLRRAGRPPGDAGALQVCGAVWVVERDSLTVGGEPIEPQRDYRVVTNSFLVNQADSQLYGAQARDIEDLGQTVFDLAVEVAEGGAPIGPLGEHWLR